MNSPASPSMGSTGLWVSTVLLFLGSIVLGVVIPIAAPFLSIVLLIGGVVGYRRLRGPVRAFAVSALAAGTVLLLGTLYVVLFLMRWDGSGRVIGG